MYVHILSREVKMLENKCKRIICCIVIFMLILGLYENGKIIQYGYNMHEYSEVLWNEIEYGGFKLTDNTFIPTEDFSCLWIKLDERNIASFQVNFAEPFNQELMSITYYSNELGNLDELHSIYKTIQQGEDYIVIDLPEDVKSTYAAFIVREEFRLNSVYISEQHAQKVEIDRGEEHLLAFLIFNCIISIGLTFFIMNVCIPYLLDKKRCVSKKVFVNAILYLGTIIVVIIILSSKLVKCFNGINVWNWYRILFIVSIITTIWGVYQFRDVVGKHPEKIFLIISLSSGILYALCLPILMETTWDAAIHYNKTTELSHIFDGAYSSLDVGHLNFSYKLQELKQLNYRYNKMYEYTDLADVKITWNTIYTYVGWLPNALFMFIFRGLGLSFVHITQLAKLGNVFTYSFVIYFAIKKINIGKMIICVIALYPTNILLASTYSYDSWLTSFTILGLSYLIYNITRPEENLKNKDIIIMILSFVIGVGPKAIYFILIFLMYMMPRCKFADKSQMRKYYVLISISILFCLLSFMLPFVSEPSGDLRGGSDVNSAKQVAYILANPLKYTKLLLSTFSNYISPQRTQQYMTLLGYKGDAKYFLLLFFTAITVTFTYHDKDEKRWINKWHRLFFLIIVFATVVLIITAMYVSFTGVGYDQVGGLQSRYLVPVLFPSAVALHTDFLEVKIRRERYNMVIFLIVAFILYHGAFTQIVMSYTF